MLLASHQQPHRPWETIPERGQRSCLVKWHELPCLSEPPDRNLLLSKRSVCPRSGMVSKLEQGRTPPPSTGRFHQNQEITAQHLVPRKGEHREQTHYIVLHC